MLLEWESGICLFILVNYYKGKTYCNYSMFMTNANLVRFAFVMNIL